MASSIAAWEVLHDHFCQSSFLLRICASLWRLLSLSSFFQVSLPFNVPSNLSLICFFALSDFSMCFFKCGLQGSKQQQHIKCRYLRNKLWDSFLDHVVIYLNGIFTLASSTYIVVLLTVSFMLSAGKRLELMATPISFFSFYNAGMGIPLAFLYLIFGLFPLSPYSLRQHLPALIFLSLHWISFSTFNLNNLPMSFWGSAIYFLLWLSLKILVLSSKLLK